jgi:hypothetical protein
LALLLGLVAAMAPAPTIGQSGAPSESSAWNYVALGDSWPEGAHCGGCETFAGLWRDGLRATFGREIAFDDLTGSQEPGLAPGGNGETSGSLLASLRFDPVTRDAIRSADIILIATGPNDLGLIFDPPPGADCGDAYLDDCIGALGRLWRDNFDAILEEIDLLRAGRPTAIRLVNADNAWVTDPALAEGRAKDFATTTGALIFQLLTDAMCHNATHVGVCVDVRPIINGPSLDQPGNPDSAATMRAVADALLATGLPELEPR